MAEQPEDARGGLPIGNAGAAIESTDKVYFGRPTTTGTVAAEGAINRIVATTLLFQLETPGQRQIVGKVIRCHRDTEGNEYPEPGVRYQFALNDTAIDALFQQYPTATFETISPSQILAFVVSTKALRKE